MAGSVVACTMKVSSTLKTPSLAETRTQKHDRLLLPKYGKDNGNDILFSYFSLFCWLISEVHNMLLSLCRSLNQHFALFGSYDLLSCISGAARSAGRMQRWRMYLGCALKYDKSA